MKKPAEASLLVTAISGVILLIVGGAAIVTAGPRFELAARVDLLADSSGARVEGRVLRGGAPVESALVWLMAHAPDGNSMAPPPVSSGKDGSFRFQLASDSVGGLLRFTQISVTAEAERPRSWYSDRQAIELRTDGTSPPRVLAVPLLDPLVLGMLFLLSLLVAFVHLETVGARRARYPLLVMLSLVMVGYLLSVLIQAIRRIDVLASQLSTDVIHLGFAYLVKGKMAAEASTDWLLLLSRPELPVNSSAIVDGFGAPVWVVLVAVAGAALYTVSLLVRAVRFRDGDVSETERLEAVLLHQFYLLVSPLGAVFVYQLLLTAGAVGADATVAVSALAAGIGLNLLLATAVRKVEEMIGTWEKAAPSKRSREAPVAGAPTPGT